MFSRLMTACAFVALATTAYAADTSSSKPSTTNVAANQESTQNQSAQNLPHEIQSKLQQDGFTDVKVVPGSFLVSAKDKRGEPVTMIIGPHSMVMMTEAKMSDSGSQNDSSAESGSHAK